MLGIQVPIILIDYHQSATMNKHLDNIIFVKVLYWRFLCWGFFSGWQISGNFHIQSLQFLLPFKPELDLCVVTNLIHLSMRNLKVWLFICVYAFFYILEINPKFLRYK